MARRELVVHLSHLDGTGVLDVRGEIDKDTAPALRDAVRRLQALRVPVVLDLREVTFMDASGLRVLTEASLASADGQPAIRVQNPSNHVRWLLEIAALDHLISSCLDVSGPMTTGESRSV